MSNFIDRAKTLCINNKKPIINTLLYIGYLFALVFLFVVIVNINMVAVTNDNIYSTEEMIKLSDDFDCILILGAGVRADGSPTPMLSDRLTTGYEAFMAKKSDIIIVSGDSEDQDYTETVTMERVLTEREVDKTAIINDGYGLSTYESIWRAKNVYGCKRILVVTQGYHLNRAIYIAKELGLEAYGLDAALQGYAKQPIYSIREYIARIKDMIYAEIRPEPAYTQKWEGFNE